MKTLVAWCALTIVGLMVACDADDAPDVVRAPDGGVVDAGADARGPVTGEHDEHDASDVDAATRPIRCTDEELSANDKTDGGALVVTFLDAANPKQYDSHCATVKVGASVTFSGSFRQHPLQAAGGDAPNPIPYTAEDQPGGELVVVMPTAGTFGYECAFHPVQMFGAIRVVP